MSELYFNSYKLAKDIDGQLKQMVQDLKSIIDHLNTANTQQQDTDDPVRILLTQFALVLLGSYVITF